ncbi:MAG: XdhC family protein [Candidatus Latescibacterota bacterium]
MVTESQVRYISVLGSRNRHERWVRRLLAAGYGEEATAKIKGPMGIDIGAKSSAEIVLSIMAEVVTVRRNW